MVAFLLRRRSTAPLPDAAPASVGFLPDRLAVADTLVADAVARHGVPCAVLLVARRGSVALRTVHGSAGLRPVPRPASVDTIFDMASCTKPVATATATLQLLERGAVVLDAPAARYLTPLQTAGGDWQWITLRHLLTHSSGLPGGIATGGRQFTLPQIVEYIVQRARLRSQPGTHFLYSDLNAILLSAIVEKVTGQPFDDYCRRFIWEPMGMSDTGFRPRGAHADRCAATTPGDDTPDRRGKVHDPTAAALGGVSGNAGLFSTADDLARFCQMLLNGGIYDGVRILRPETVTLATTPQSRVPEGTRGLGWDIDTAYSSPRGDLPRGSYGHTGYTGTSLWIDPKTQTFIILLTNAVHAGPDAVNAPVRQYVIHLRRVVANAVASAIPELNLPAPPPPMPSAAA